MSRKLVRTDEHGDSWLKRVERLLGLPVELTVDGGYRDWLLRTYEPEPEAARRWLATWSLRNMPGCRGIFVSHGVQVAEELRGKGLGTMLNRMRIQLCWSLNRGLVACTTVSVNLAEQKVLTKNEWRRVTEFQNPRTRNNVMLYIRRTYNTGLPLGFELTPDMEEAE